MIIARVEHIFALQQELQLYEVYQKAIAKCDSQIEQHLTQFSDQMSAHAQAKKLSVKGYVDDLADGD